VPSGRDEEIAVRLVETDGVDEVAIINQPAIKESRVTLTGGQ